MHSLLVEIKLLQTQLLVQLISEAISSLSTAQQDIPHKKNHLGGNTKSKLYHSKCMYMMSKHDSYGPMLI